MQNDSAMISDRQSFAQKLTAAIVQELHPEKVILFGSVAKGEERESSDIDLFIVQETKEPYPQRLKPIFRLAQSLGYPYSLEPIIYTPAEFQRAMKDGSALVAEILHNGKTLYEH